MTNFVETTSPVHLAKSDEADMAPWMRRHLLNEHFSTINASIAGNGLNASLLTLAFWGSHSPIFFVATLSLLAVLMAARMRNAREFGSIGEDESKLKLLQKVTEHKAGLLGIWWGSMVVIFMNSGATPAQQVLCACFGAGMMAGGAMNYRSLRKAGYFYITASGLLTCAGLASVGEVAGTVTVGMGICYWATLMVSIRQMSRNTIDRHQRVRDLRESSETINLLLADFTEQGSDWMIEMDGQGNIINPSEQLAVASRRPLQTLEGGSILELFDHGPERDDFAEHLSRGRSFRNHQLSLSIGKERLWWSINARPVNEDGSKYRAIVTDITAQRLAEEQVSYMAHFDSLTELPNRFQFNRRLGSILHDDEAALGLMYLDLDQFKVINDTLGHSFGDLLLKGVARRLESCVSAGEVVARLGGDEFAILFKNNSLEHLESVGAKIINSLTLPFRLDDHDIIVGTSIGISIAPDHANDASNLLRNADLALYEAKAQGRNRQVVFEPGMDEASQLRRALELDLRGALGKQELCLHYQPLVQIESGETLGYEALIRWEHPERGVVMPDAFIPIAEESGMIIPIGEWVIRQALDDLLQWPDTMTVSINLSPSQMRSPSLITTLVHALAKTGVAPKRVCLEITETVLMQDSEVNLATLHKLHEIGVEIALDDFGTGYSSLNYLRSFPFDKIKIDRCFVDEIDTREDCRAIVRSVVNLANSLGMTTTAEGVERSDQVEHLRREGCSNVQGYLFSKAVPQDQLTNLRKPIHSHAQRLVRLETERRDNSSKLAQLDGAKVEMKVA
jgi:diguanylate cyclase (GGDEF)-like protein